MVGFPTAVDHEALAESLAALAYPARLELLEHLRAPKGAGDIQLRPRKAAESGSSDRAAARQTVVNHLAKLVAAELVREERVEEGGRTLVRYATNSPRLYEVLDDLRRVCILTMSLEGSMETTQTLEDAAPAAAASGPRLVLVRGLYEGRVYPLVSGVAEGVYVVGRRRTSAVCLDFDRYVSAENALLRRRADDVTVENVPGSKNGTTVNWRRLRDGEALRLRAGDVVTVGRSALVFATG